MWLNKIALFYLTISGMVYSLCRSPAQYLKVFYMATTLKHNYFLELKVHKFSDVKLCDVHTQKYIV